MKHFFDDHVKFLVSYIPGHSCIEVAEEFSKKYFPVTPKQIYAFKCSRKIKSGTKGGPSKGYSKLFTKEIREFIFANNKGNSLAKITALVNDKFGTKFTERQLKTFRENNHLNSGLTGRFEKGHISANKGKKGWHAPGSEKGWFRKGNEPWNKLPVGSEVTDTTGYLRIKVAEPNVWEFKHKMVWEKHHGKVPPGHVLTFLDGNKMNCEIGNLRLISTAENVGLNLLRLRCESAELMETSLAIVKLKLKVSAITREKKNVKDE